MQSDDPFAAPASTIADPSGSSGSVSPGVVETLRRTKGWVRLMAILGLIGAAFMLLAGIAIGIMAAVGGNMGEPDMPMGFFVGYAFFLILMAVLYLLPSLRLLRFAGGIARLEVQRDASVLEDALEQQRAFWRYVGIMTLALLAIYGLVLLGVIAFGAMTAMRGGA